MSVCPGQPIFVVIVVDGPSSKALERDMLEAVDPCRRELVVVIVHLGVAFGLMMVRV